MNQQEEFDFQQEIELLHKGQFIKSYQITPQNPHPNCILQLQTLDDYNFTIECSISQSLKIVDSNHPNKNSISVFESFEQLLMFYSPQYQKKFNQDLFLKLQPLTEKN